MTRKPVVFALTIATAAVLALSQAAATPPPATEAQAAAPERPSADAMLNAWQSVAGKLGPEAMNRMAFAFDGDERLAWFYTPVDRTGFPLGEMDEAQERELRKLLDAGLGSAGTSKVFDIIALEEVLFALSGGRAMRDPGNYFLSTFGVPSTEGAWGWRFEGHHTSVNFTIIDGQVVAGTPAFFGGNPAIVGNDYPERAGFSPFTTEEELGRQLVQAFAPAQRSVVVINVEAPSDILTTNSARAEMGAPEGIALGDMTDEQEAMVMELLGVYTERMNRALADYQMAKIRQAGMERVHFAWAGGLEPGEPHYYRIHGPTFVIEYDNTQNNANHVHSVWRDFDDDFGNDPLRAHLARDHGLKVTGFTPIGDRDLGATREIADDQDDEAAHRRLHTTGTAHNH